jgi:hypothetical protein
MKNNNNNNKADHISNQHDWDVLRNILKEKLTPNTVNTHENSTKDYWERFQALTGKTREEMFSLLKNI